MTQNLIESFAMYFVCVGIPMTIIFLIAIWGYLYTKDDKQNAFERYSKFKHGGTVDGTVDGTKEIMPGMINKDILAIGIGLVAIAILCCGRR